MNKKKASLGVLAALAAAVICAGVDYSVDTRESALLTKTEMAGITGEGTVPYSTCREYLATMCFGENECDTCMDALTEDPDPDCSTMTSRREYSDMYVQRTESAGPVNNKASQQIAGVLCLMILVCGNDGAVHLDHVCDTCLEDGDCVPNSGIKCVECKTLMEVGWEPPMWQTECVDP